MGVPPFRVLSVCTGGAGLDRGLRRAEPTARTVCYVEIEAFACAVLAAQMEAGDLDQAPIWTDARTFDGRAWRGAVDCVVAGFPCQDISSAGKRAGIHGERSGVWFDMARIVRDVGARYVFLENVDALLVRGIDTVLGSLAEMGFAAAWGVFSAAEVGAPHLRERVFILGVADANASGHGTSFECLRTRQSDLARCDAHMGHADRSRLAGRSRERPRWLASETGEVLDHANSGRRWGQINEVRARRDQPESPEFPPDRADMRAWAAVQAGFEPAVCRLADGLDVGLRTDWLRLLGNGVVPQQAEHAYRTLRAQLGKDLRSERAS